MDWCAAVAAAAAAVAVAAAAVVAAAVVAVVGGTTRGKLTKWCPPGLGQAEFSKTAHRGRDLLKKRKKKSIKSRYSLILLCTIYTWHTLYRSVPFFFFKYIISHAYVVWSFF